MSSLKNITKIGGHVFEKCPLPEGAGEMLRSVELQLSTEDVLQRLGKRPWRSQLVEAVATILRSARDLWQPMAVYRWFDISWEGPGTLRLDTGDPDRCVLPALGCAAQFLQKARKILVGVYTVGRELEEHAQRASGEKRIFDAFLHDIVGLAVLDALGAAVGHVAEDYAAERGWGVGPLLSPGSVHGWDMADQVILDAARKIAEKVSVVGLATSSDFQERFVANLYFPALPG